MKVCPRCGVIKPLSDFYKRSGSRSNETAGHCKSCQNEQTKLRQQGLKAKAVKYKGGKCIHCGIVGHPAIYDFHHVNPSEKSFTLSKRKSANITDEIREELDKCELLCANCHRIEHATY